MTWDGENSVSLSNQAASVWEGRIPCIRACQWWLGRVTVYVDRLTRRGEEWRCVLVQKNTGCKRSIFSRAISPVRSSHTGHSAKDGGVEAGCASGCVDHFKNFYYIGDF